MKFGPVFRAINLVLVAALIGMVAWTFKVKHDTRTEREEVAKLQRQIDAETVEIDLLNSDWGLLTSPERLEQLVERYGQELALEQMAPSQMTDQSLLPPVKQLINPQDVDEDFAGTDETIRTGSIPNQEVPQ